MTDTPNNTFNTHVHGGRVVSGQVTGGIVVLGDYHAAGQPATTASSGSSQLSTEDWQKKLETVQTTLKKMYMETFKKTNPFSLPFTFDIENTWVSLALREERNHSHATESHAELLKNAFAKEKMLIIEGKPATGKSSLMRRLAYEWAKGNYELSHFDIVAYAEFREVREKTFESIADLVLEFTKGYIEDEEFTELKSLLSDRNYCKKQEILLLLDGYDESSLDKHCSELTTYLTSSKIKKELLFNIVLTTRPGYLSVHRGKEGRHIFADVLGFITEEQKETYISSHFSNTPQNERQRNIEAICNLLSRNKNLNNLAETPLFLTFICLIHEKLVVGTLFELYLNIIWWLFDRYQKDHLDFDVAELSGFVPKATRRKLDKFQKIEQHFTEFPVLKNIGKMSFAEYTSNVFFDDHLDKYEIDEITLSIGLLVKSERTDELRHRITEYMFPHRTIQEFLAGGVYYFWNETEIESSNASLATEMFNSSFAINPYEVGEIKASRTMNELEKFTWTTAQLKDARYLDSSARFFRQYKAVTVDMSVCNQPYNLQETPLNKYLHYCINTTMVHFTKSDGIFRGTDPLNLEYMNLLESTTFSGNGEMESPKKTECNQKPLKNILIISPKNNIRDVTFSEYKFPSEDCFTSTMQQLNRNLSPTATISLRSVAISCTEFDLILNHYASIPQPPSNMSSTAEIHPEAYQTAEKKLGRVLECCRDKIIGHLDIILRKLPELSFSHSPTTNSISAISFTSFTFTKNETVATILNRLPTLRSIRFVNCKFAQNECSSICSIISQSTVLDISLCDTIFEDEQHFLDFYVAMKSCGNITRLQVLNDNLPEREDIQNHSNRSVFDATEIFKDLVQNMNSLEELFVRIRDAAQESSSRNDGSRRTRYIIDSKSVMDAGLCRNSTFSCNVV